MLFMLSTTVCKLLFSGSFFGFAQILHLYSVCSFGFPQILLHTYILQCVYAEKVISVAFYIRTDNKPG